MTKTHATSSFIVIVLHVLILLIWQFLSFLKINKREREWWVSRISGEIFETSLAKFPYAESELLQQMVRNLANTSIVSDHLVNYLHLFLVFVHVIAMYKIQIIWALFVLHRKKYLKHKLWVLNLFNFLWNPWTLKLCPYIRVMLHARFWCRI